MKCKSYHFLLLVSINSITHTHNFFVEIALVTTKMDMLLRFYLFFVTFPNLVASGSSRSRNLLRSTQRTRQFISCDDDEYKLVVNLAENQILSCQCPSRNPTRLNHRVICKRKQNIANPDEESNEMGTLYEITYDSTCGEYPHRFRRAPVIVIFRPHRCGQKQGNNQIPYFPRKPRDNTDTNPQCM